MKTVLITGGARGIGRALVRAYAPDCNVAFTHRSTAPDATLSEAPKAIALHTDLSDPDALAALPGQVVEHFGGLDILIHNAGSLHGDTSEEADPARIAENYAINVIAPQMLTAAAMPFLSPGACVIAITSTNARLPAMSAQSYSASKAALETWTRIAAKTLGPKGIRVNAVAPGAVNIPEAPRPDDVTALFTRDTALGALATSDDIARAARFLTSQAAKSITGHILDVNGGYRL